jgi:3',5'-nucleoside bisphosphate phosphatase
MNANMHLHSRYSDGTIWPEEIVSRAKNAGLEFISLTDHDSLGGSLEFNEAASDAGIASMTAVEIDCTASDPDYRSELLGYFPDSQPACTARLLENVGRERQDCMREAIEKARIVFRDGSLSFEALTARKMADRWGEVPLTGFSFNKVDVFLYLKSSGVIHPETGYYDFKKTWFDSGLLSARRKPKPTVSEVIRSIHDDGGKAVIPHPGHEFGDSLREMDERSDHLAALLAFFADEGVDGIELYYYRTPDREELNSRFRDLAKHYGFLLTFGSDCHGPGSGKDTIASFSGPFDAFSH